MKIAYIIILISVIAIAVAGIFYSTINPDNVRAELPLDRPTYNDVDNNIVFNELPEFPSNFDIIKRDVYDGQITDLNKVSESIYKQPEFYPTWERNGLSWFIDHDYTRWGVHGYEFYPGEISYNVVNMTVGDEINIYSFLHTSWGIETWQGLRLVPEYNSNYFEVSITPDEVLLEPTFPKFYNNWSQKTTLNIIATQPVPTGIYTFSVKFDAPSSKTSNVWLWQTIDKYTENKFHNEIQKCMDSISYPEKCDTWTESRQNKYISSGGAFAPSNQYTVIINAI